MLQILSRSAVGAPSSGGSATKADDLEDALRVFAEAVALLEGLPVAAAARLARTEGRPGIV